MSPMTVVDRPLCCSSGVCGPEPDLELVRFAADVDWLEQQGVAVTRINPSQDPEAFLAQEAVVRVFDEKGNACLPAIVVDGILVSSGRYPERDQLAEFAGLGCPDDGLVTPAVTELVAIGAAIASNCEPCFRYHYAQALTLGVSRADMTRAVTIAQTVKDAPAQAVLDMAHRYLSGDATRDDPAPATGCCGGPATTAAETPKPSSGCCC